MGGLFKNVTYSSANRNTQPELMDDPSLNPETLKLAVQDVNRVNNLLGGYRFTYKAVKTIIENLQNTHPEKPIGILDAGCGNGSMLRYLAARLPSGISFHGIDFSENSIHEAQSYKAFKNISYHVADINTLSTHNSFDIVLSTLTLHHLSDEEIISFLSTIKSLASTAVVINDLHRNKLSYYLFAFLSPIFMKSSISVHDGLVSIASGFKRTDFKKYNHSLKLPYTLKWKWSFRYLWILHTYER